MATDEQTRIIGPQPGYQTKFLSCPADIVIGGSGAGVGKSFALLLDACRGVVRYEGYGATIFRQSYPEIIMQGGLWDESQNIFPEIGGAPNASKHRWTFPETISQIAFRYLSHEDQLRDWGGSQIPYIGWDELTHFTRKMFIYMLTRNRIGSMKSLTPGMPLMRPKMRGTCNPDPDSWLAEFLEWWIDQDTGFPIPERSGVIRYMIIDQDQFVWGSTREEVRAKAPHVIDLPEFKGIPLRDLIKSVTFIPGNIMENKELLTKNPGYLANLLSQSEEEQLRFLKGNWKIRTDNLSLFDWVSLEDMFHNLIPERANDKYYITIDHAGGGTKYQGIAAGKQMEQDLCVIITWKGWKIVRMDALTMANTNLILERVREIRSRYRPIPVSQIIVDQDGVGVKDALRCHLFQGGSAQNLERLIRDTGAMDRNEKMAVQYEHKKTQCTYKLAEKVNAKEVGIDLTNVWIDGVICTSGQYKHKGKTYEVRRMIKDNLRAIKRENPDSLGRKKITNKEKQKVALGGLSPDWGDAMVMRSQFDYEREPAYMRS